MNNKRKKELSILLSCCALASICSILGCSSAKVAKTSLMQPTNSLTDKSSSTIPETPTPQVIKKTLILDNKSSKYSYLDMQSDLQLFNQAYKDITTLNTIGTTVDGKNLYDLVIGSPNSTKSIIIIGSIHAREYITTQLIMKQLAYYLSNLSNNDGEYNNQSFQYLFKNVSVHVIPMINPDGVMISQQGLNGIQNESVKQQVLSILSESGNTADYFDFSQWKSNACGVDLNRNFDAKWSEYNNGASHPSIETYKGTAPGSEYETKALIQLTENNPVVFTLSYHTYGQVIYWYFGQTGNLYDATYDYAKTASTITGYQMDSNYENLDPAGYKDWALSKKGIPSLTIEVGYGKNPVPIQQFDDIYNQNRDIWASMLYCLKEQGGQ